MRQLKQGAAGAANLTKINKYAAFFILIPLDNFNFN